MGRVATGDVVITRPTNNIYTVLAGIGFIVQLLGLLVLFLQAESVGGLLSK